jgi:hypothetical protein
VYLEISTAQENAMPLPVITDTIRCSVEGLLANGESWANILHARKSGVLTFAGAITVLEAHLPQFWTNHVAGSPAWGYYAGTGASVQRVRYTPLDGSTPTTVVSHIQAGANATDPLPAQDALALTLYTATRGRRYRGRFFMGGFTEGENDATGHALASMVTDLTAQFQAVITGLVGTGVSLVVASYGRPDAANPSGWTPFATDVTSFVINSKWDTIRRRGRR